MSESLFPTGTRDPRPENDYYAIDHTTGDYKRFFVDTKGARKQAHDYARQRSQATGHPMIVRQGIALKMVYIDGVKLTGCAWVPRFDKSIFRMT